MTENIVTLYNPNTCERVIVERAPHNHYNVYDGRTGRNSVHQWVLGHIVRNLRTRLECEGFVQV